MTDIEAARNWITAWVKRTFYERIHFQAEGGTTAQGNLPVKTGSDGLIDPSFYVESGDWTAVLADADTGGNEGTLTVTDATYVKIGRLVFLRMTASASGKVGLTGANAIRVRGIPYAPATGASGAASLNSTTFSGYIISRVSAANPNSVSFLDHTSGGARAAVTVTNFGAGALDFTIVYETDD